MSVNVYRYRESIFYDPDQPIDRFGFCLMTSGCVVQNAVFDSEEKLERYLSRAKLITGSLEDWRFAPISLLVVACEDDDSEAANDVFCELLRDRGLPIDHEVLSRVFTLCRRMYERIAFGDNERQSRKTMATWLSDKPSEDTFNAE